MQNIYWKFKLEMMLLKLTEKRQYTLKFHKKHKSYKKIELKKQNKQTKLLKQKCTNKKRILNFNNACINNTKIVPSPDNFPRIFLLKFTLVRVKS